MNTLSKFIPVTFQRPRSSKRTDFLHACLVNEFIKDYPQYGDLTWTYEQKIPDAYNYDKDGNELPRVKSGKNKGKYKRTFKVDIVGYDKDGVPRVIICAKGLNNNVLQNLFNYMNTTLGESDRLLYGPHENDIEKMYFVTVFPNKTAYFTKNGLIKRIEDVAKRMFDTDPTYMLKKKHGDKIGVVKYSYDIVDLDNYTHKSQFESGIEFINLKKHE